MLFTQLMALSQTVKDNVIKSLDIMWKGVVAIFVVIALVILCTEVLKRAIKVAEAKKQLKQAEKEAAEANSTHPKDN